MIPGRWKWLGLAGLSAALFGGQPQSAPSAPAALSRTSLMEYRNDRGQVVPVTSVADWQKRRAEILQTLQEIMGPLPHPARRGPPVFRIEEEVGYKSFVLRRITYDAGPGESVPAYLLVPKEAEAGKAKVPAVLCLHGTDDRIGYKTVVGLGDGPPNRNYAAELAARGYVTLSPAYPLLANYHPDLKALGYASGTMKAIWDNMRGIDLLASLPFVKPGAFAVMGQSLGGHNAVFTATFGFRRAS